MFDSIWKEKKLYIWEDQSVALAPGRSVLGAKLLLWQLAELVTTVCVCVRVCGCVGVVDV